MAHLTTTDDLRLRVISTVAEARAIEVQVLASAEATVTWLREFKGSPLELLAAMRFTTAGRDPLSDRPLNVVEQLNQTFTVLVALRAVEALIELHPDAGGFRPALGAIAGRDIESVQPGLVAAEVFAAVHPSNNDKLASELRRLRADNSRHRYVSFSSPGFAPGRRTELEKVAGIQVHCVDLSATQMPRIEPSPDLGAFVGKSVISLRDDWFRNLADDASLALSGIYEWRIEGVGLYVGKSKDLASRLREYPNNVRKLLAGEPYRKSKPDKFRLIHAHSPTRTIDVSPSASQCWRRARSRHSTSVSGRGSSAGAKRLPRGGPPVLNGPRRSEDGIDS